MLTVMFCEITYFSFYRCLHYFPTEAKLNMHSVLCANMNNCAITLPSESQKELRFRNYARKERVPFVVYADMECILEKQAYDESINTYAYQHHKPFSMGYYVQCAFDSSHCLSYRSRRDDDCVAWFVNELDTLAQRIKDLITEESRTMRDLTRDEWNNFNDEAAYCHVCEKSFAPDDIRVRDHCHFTGEYRGPAHVTCNLMYRNSFYVPVIFHNLSGYDAHFIITKVATAFEGRIDLLPITKERYISFTKYVQKTANYKECIKFRFIDSFKFLNTSLDKLASYLNRDKMQVSRNEFHNLSDEDFVLLTRKGVFPYDYIDSVNRLAEMCLPTRDSFKSTLTGDMLSESDYAHAIKVWQRFSIHTLGDYSDLYLKTDVLLLADVFENFRETCIRSYGLDPAHYYTLPGFTWDAMLKHTGVTFELFTDIDMVMFIERGVRGGLSQCSNRYARANNKYVPETHDSLQPSSYLMYYDVNNLYGWAMSQPLPYADFRWLNDFEMSMFDVNEVSWDSSVGYILEVDLAYPLDIHDAHADLPFCPVHDIPPGGREEKLLASLNDKKYYVIHYRALQQCLRHGVQLTCIHRVLRFAQSPWLRTYITLNTDFRAKASNDFEKNMYKLMNNAVFGKTMENVRNRVNVKLVTKWEGRWGAEALIAKPNFHSRSVFSENLIAIELRKLDIFIDKPIYVGMSILDISKTCVYEFHYDYMLPLYNDKCKLMYTDTDSLIYYIECEDVYDNMKYDITRFDTSDYSPDNVYDMPRLNKKIPGLMKDENNGVIMMEFVGLRSKMYAYRVVGKNEMKKSKGVKRSVINRSITFDDYMHCLRNDAEITRRQACIRSKLHEVYSVSERKIALSSYDNKRRIVQGCTDTLPWGHYGVLM